MIWETVLREGRVVYIEERPCGPVKIDSSEDEDSDEESLDGHGTDDSSSLPSEAAAIFPMKTTIGHGVYSQSSQSPLSSSSIANPKP